MNDLEHFRHRAQEWLTAEAAAQGWLKDDVDRTGPDRVAHARRCQRALFDAGFAGITWPEEYGGRGLGFREQAAFNDVARAFDLPLNPFIIGLGMCGPTLLALGTEQQKQRYIAKMLSGEEIWCQLFSEPGAGSDVASLSTRAELRGDRWVISGSKVWTSGADISDFGMLLARTDVDAPKHGGLTMFVVDMSLAGIDIRPIHQMDGGSRFSEVYFDDVELELGSVIGEVGGGWSAATTTLANERVSLGAVRTLNDVPSASALAAKATRSGAVADATVRQQLMDVWTREVVVQLLGARVTTAILKGETPGPQGSIAKLCRTEYTRRAARLATTLDGADAIAWVGERPESASALLYAPCLSIAGGTDEVLRNIIGERVLGLPREPKVQTETNVRSAKWSAS